MQCIDKPLANIGFSQDQAQRIVELCTVNNTLSNKVDRQREEIKSRCAEIDMLQTLVQENHDKMAKSREMNRRSIVDIETKLDQIAADTHSQVSTLQSQLADEVKLRSELLEQLHQSEGHIAQKEAEVESFSYLTNFFCEEVKF
jgi:chromosome segregation ATPase